MLTRREVEALGRAHAKRKSMVFPRKFKDGYGDTTTVSHTCGSVFLVSATRGVYADQEYSPDQARDVAQALMDAADIAEAYNA